MKRQGFFTNDKNECTFHKLNRPTCILLRDFPGVDGSLCAGSLLVKVGASYITLQPIPGTGILSYPEVSIPEDVVESYNNGRYFCLVQP